MDLRLRLAPAGLVAVLLVIRAYRHDFLSQTPIPHVPVSLFWLILLPLSYVAAWLLTPPFVRLVNITARRAFIPFIVFLALVVGALWAIDGAWNHTFAAWWDLPKSHLLSGLTAALYGGAEP